MEPLTEEKITFKERFHTVMPKKDARGRHDEPLASGQGIIIQDGVIYYIRNFDIPADLVDRTLYDSLVDAYTPPGQLGLLRPNSGLMAHIWNRACLNQHFKRAMAQFKFPANMSPESR